MKQIEVKWKVLHEYTAIVNIPDNLDEDFIEDYLRERIEQGTLNETETNEELDSIDFMEIEDEQL